MDSTYKGGRVRHHESKIIPNFLFDKIAITPRHAASSLLSLLVRQLAGNLAQYPEVAQKASNKGVWDLKLRINGGH